MSRSAKFEIAVEGPSKPPGGADRDPRVVPLSSAFTDEALLEALRQRRPGAETAFFRRFHDYVERLVTRVLGFDSEIPDIVQDTFVGALRGAQGFRGDAQALPSWVGQIAIRTARGTIRRRKARSWLDLQPPAALQDLRASQLKPEERQLVEHTYRVLERLPVKERIVFVLRALEELEVTEVAALCDISVATVKRRSQSARERFWRLAERDPVLREAAHEWHARRIDDVDEGPGRKGGS